MKQEEIIRQLLELQAETLRTLQKAVELLQEQINSSKGYQLVPYVPNTIPNTIPNTTPNWPPYTPYIGDPPF